METVDCVQGSPEWHEARRGIVTASRIKDVMAKNVKRDGPGLTRATYMRQLAGEIITGQPMETFKSPAMERGNTMEEEARNSYAFMRDCTPETVGFIRAGDMGCSPDSLLGHDGILEIKTQRADLLIETIEAGVFPAEHVAQCQGNLAVTGRKWLDLCVYWPGMPLFVKRIERDSPYIIKMMQEVSAFQRELAAMVDRIRAYR